MKYRNLLYDAESQYDRFYIRIIEIIGFTLLYFSPSPIAFPEIICYNKVFGSFETVKFLERSAYS